MANQTFPDQILQIQNFLDSCQYNQINKGKFTYYRNINQIEKQKQCICFDGALYAKTKIDQLNNPSIQTQILSIFGITNENGKKIPKAHSVCLIKINNKYGCIGKSSSKEMEFRQPIYNSIEQIVLTFLKPFFERKIWVNKYQIEDEKNFHLLQNENSNQLMDQNQIFLNTRPNTNYFKPITIGQYLHEIEKIELEKISNLLETIQ